MEKQIANQAVYQFDSYHEVSLSQRWRHRARILVAATAMAKASLSSEQEQRAFRFVALCLWMHVPKP